ncbi:glycine cleavage system transcriptional repressor [Microbispora sp. RL4-1S]|uniref:Glycine cleavage system transcriptional repressor n=1 Tax=Microbispora oryzae TaxID=2806554 RepID=A0A940WTL2_9ACTN|nr:ACT domain-containing protein [Microbispora oryzae]MBP2707190.1 glycine cleavage system transcriptional repressor [Microbispora oryzae]
MGLYAVTAVGRDRPGAIADVTRALADFGAIGDSAAITLGGRFAMTLVASAPDGADRLREGLAHRLPGLTVTVADLASRGPDAPERLAYVLTVHGPSRAPTLPVLTGLLAEAGCDITSLTTRAPGELLVAVADVGIPAPADVASLMRRVATALDGYRVALHPAEPVVM